MVVPRGKGPVVVALLPPEPIIVPQSSFSGLFWGFLLLYGVTMYWLSPRANTVTAFFRGTDDQGQHAGQWMLMFSIFISWIFAKSVTNAANLGAAHGVVGGLAYATYWLSIPFAGWVIYQLRTRLGATGLVPFIAQRYGRWAALAFAAAILIRLYNEIWSNSSVVGAYYGAPGSSEFIGAALLFTAATLVYAMKGGLRSSIITDLVQSVLFIAFLATVLVVVIPQHGPARLVAEGEFALNAGLDLLLVALLQILSYPFHDPVLTDRGFITGEKTMLRAFIVAGLLGFACIFAFSLVGVHARLEKIPGGDNMPGAVALAFGTVPFILMTCVMILAAGSTVDSTFASLSKAVARDLPQLAGREPANPIQLGLWTMVAFALLGNLPMIAGTDILKATTVSGTMVMGLAPVFVLARFVNYSPWSFHFSFWPGVLVGIGVAANWLSPAWAIGDGRYGLLLGANVYGLLICTAGFMLPLAWRRLHSPVVAA